MSLTAEEFGRLAIGEIDTLNRFANSLTPNPAEADDLVQETYLRAIRGRDRFEMREQGLRPWLMRIMHNVFLTRAVRAKRQPVPTDPADLQLLGVADNSFPLVSPEMDDDLRRAMDALPH